ncbi:MAG: hypothetical protein KC978_08045 [Candidatus Omnitrophica bacterium]|nr:hypothetical protein [Candidatus Omnitrophota bacterium]
MRFLPTLLFFLVTQSSQSQPMASGFPEVGANFKLHQECVTTGTGTIGESDPFDLRQSLNIYGDALILESTPGVGSEVRFSFDRMTLEVDIPGEGSSLLEILPGKVIIDGTAVYDRERDPDIPVGLLDLVINEDIEVVLNDHLDQTEIRQFRKNRTERSFFNLLSVVRETLVPIPPDQVNPGEVWVVRRPLSALGGDFVLPATETFQFNEEATPQNPLRTLQKTVVASLEEPKTVAIRMGMTATPNLVFDALGPNITAPPPPMKIARFDYDSKGVLEFNTDWGFPQRVGSISNIVMESEVPPPDGIEMKRKMLVLVRQTLTTLERVEPIPLSEDQEELFLGPHQGD